MNELRIQITNTYNPSQGILFTATYLHDGERVSEYNAVYDRTTQWEDMDYHISRALSEAKRIFGPNMDWNVSKALLEAQKFLG